MYRRDASAVSAVNHPRGKAGLTRGPVVPGLSFIHRLYEAPQSARLPKAQRPGQPHRSSTLPQKDAKRSVCPIGQTQTILTINTKMKIDAPARQPKTEILGAPDLFINRGSTINLTCVILQSPEPPAYIFWNHNDAIISYDSNRGGVSVVTEKGDSTTSFLLVQEAKPSDSGRYTCNPSNAQPKSITVHVLNGEYPAAMQHGGQAKQPRLYSLLLCLCLLLY
ncbi:hypothetical protein ACFW04_008451 [Cataglyphis niger]